jgi:hypothetical protein
MQGSDTQVSSENHDESRYGRAVNRPVQTGRDAPQSMDNRKGRRQHQCPHNNPRPRFKCPVSHARLRQESCHQIRGKGYATHNQGVGHLGADVIHVVTRCRHRRNDRRVRERGRVIAPDPAGQNRAEHE